MLDIARNFISDYDVDTASKLYILAPISFPTLTFAAFEKIHYLWLHVQ